MTQAVGDGGRAYSLYVSGPIFCEERAWTIPCY